jgi:hypothetical protein
MVLAFFRTLTLPHIRMHDKTSQPKAIEKHSFAVMKRGHVTDGHSTNDNPPMMGEMGHDGGVSGKC